MVCALVGGVAVLGYVGSGGFVCCGFGGFYC